MITVLFFLFLALVVFHFVYDGILAPSFRFEIKIRLFELRDRLRELKLENDVEINDDLFEGLQHDINKQIRLLHTFNVVGIYHAFKYVSKDNEFDKRFKEFQQQINDCKVEEVRRIQFDSATQFMKAVFANAGGWAIYFLPLTIVCMAGIGAGFVINRFVKFATKVLRSPDEEFFDAFGSPA